VIPSTSLSEVAAQAHTGGSRSWKKGGLPWHVRWCEPIIGGCKAAVRGEAESVSTIICSISGYVHILRQKGTWLYLASACGWKGAWLSGPLSSLDPLVLPARL